MFNISSFLEKISKNIKSTQIDREEIIATLKKHTQIDFKKEDIELKDCVLYINTSPAIKNKIFIYKEKIINDLGLTTKIINIK